MFLHLRGSLNFKGDYGVKWHMVLLLQGNFLWKRLDHVSICHWIDKRFCNAPTKLKVYQMTPIAAVFWIQYLQTPKEMQKLDRLSYYYCVAFSGAISQERQIITANVIWHQSTDGLCRLTLIDITVGFNCTFARRKENQCWCPKFFAVYPLSTWIILKYY